MMKKRLSKTIWYGSDVDTEGNPLVPPAAKDANDLEGLHHGELYLHEADEKMTLWSRSASGRVLPIGVVDEKPAVLWEVRSTASGDKYIWTNFPVVTQQGITMYADGTGLDIPSIYDGLRLDNDTIYWEEVKDEEGNVVGKVLKARVDGGGGTASFENVREEGSGNAFTSLRVSEDGLSLTLVKGETFATKTEFDALNTKVGNFLEGSDTDSIINKWKELEAFLSGMKESDNLATILSNKADKATTLAGYGITNAYTKTEVNDLLDGFATEEWVGDNYLSLAGGTLEGALRLRTGSEYTSPYLYFGDGSEVYLREATDQYLTIHADKGVILDTPKTTIDGIDIYKSNDDVLFIDANLVVRGGITMYGTDGTTSSSIWDNAPVASTSVKGIASFDSAFFKVTDGKVTFIGETGGGGIESITKQMVIDALGYTPYNSTNPSNYISGITSAMITSALGFTPVSSSGTVANATTATKLSTTSKTAWGQTYWTSGGVPTNISGQISNVDSIIPSSDYEWLLGNATRRWHSLYAYNVYVYDSAYGMTTFTNGLELKTSLLFRITQKGTTRVYMNNSGYVGIGTSSPSYLLDVAGGIRSTGPVICSRVNVSSVDSDYDGTEGYRQGDYMILRYTGSTTVVSGKTHVYLRPNGTGSSSGEAYVDSSGNFLVSGGVTMYSDERKKTILNHVELSLKEIADAPLIEHYYNSDDKKTTHVGSVAQYWAGLNDWFCKKDGDGFYTMEIQNAALASAISVARELSRFESETDRRIRLLEKENEELKKEIETLKGL